MAYFRLTLTQLFAVSHIVYCVNVEFRAYDEETYGKYYSYVEFSRRFKHLAEKYPHICHLASVGKSAEGRELWVMRITAHTDLLRDVPEKPRFRYSGNIYGDEVLSRQILIYLTDYLLRQYGSDPRVTDLIDSTDIYIFPSVNPDGAEKAVEGDCTGSKAGQENHKQFDLNPKFDPNALEGAPEMLAVIKWVLQKK